MYVVGEQDIIFFCKMICKQCWDFYFDGITLFPTCLFLNVFIFIDMCKCVHKSTNARANSILWEVVYFSLNERQFSGIDGSAFIVLFWKSFTCSTFASYFLFRLDSHGEGMHVSRCFCFRSFLHLCWIFTFFKWMWEQCTVIFWVNVFIVFMHKFSYNWEEKADEV